MKSKQDLIALFCGLALCLGLVSCSSETEKISEEPTNSREIAGASAALPSWNDGDTKQAIIGFVEEVTNSESPNYIKPEDRIATFDNDGTLWSEQPVYFQFFFAIDRIKTMAADHPEWKDQQPYKAILEKDMPALMEQGKAGLLKVVMTTHAGMTTDEFEKIVSDWIATAKHPTKNRPYTDLIFQPMLELVQYLHAYDFKVFIVSGGGIEFMRPWAEEVYGIPRDRVVGSSIKTEYDYNDGQPIIKRLPEIDLIDDKEGKPIGIHRYIGRKPVFAAGNSDGDLQMLRWTAANSAKSFKLYVHHTDEAREWAYDRDSHIGTFDKGWDEAKEKGWTLVDMKEDWKVIYPHELDSVD
ncbi:haloacid dehalogenase-like hydrolase [Echinicola strongylocentroti]|uniref:phosphoserine phosphatase n=1 Tax=Echinicola strongylocentroti TaxID=1795355 RepID=A0A2Z4IN39_9BACT|nr:HAD family hydrolase [Echinicola strongylocentroti]AWW32048.1 haloacid dehalogenase-like hydrolase [Echinicola strongylocentroti]